MKYIRHKTLGFVLFEGNVQHADVAKKLGDTSEIVSAGFVFAVPGHEPKCLGFSGTLGIGAAPNDAADLRGRLAAVA